MKKLWSNIRTGQSANLREQTDDREGKQTADHMVAPPDYEIRQSGRVLELQNRDLWLRPTDMSWHVPILMTIREEPFKNYRSRTSEKWKAKEDKVEEAKKKKKTKECADEWNSVEWQKLDCWKHNEQQLQKSKIIDSIFVPIKWEIRRTVARNCTAQNLTNHWPVMTYVRLSEKKEGWRYENNSSLKGWNPKTERDETGFGTMIVGSLEDAENPMGDISVEEITKNLPSAARAVEFESTGGGNRLIK